MRGRGDKLTNFPSQAGARRRHAIEIPAGHFITFQAHADDDRHRLLRRQNALAMSAHAGQYRARPLLEADAPADSRKCRMGAFRLSALLGRR